MKHELALLANKIDWPTFEKKFGTYYIDKKVHPGTPTRLMVGLHYLKYVYDDRDESVVYRFFENPYWQYFCGYEYFQTSFPIDPSSLTHFRKRIGSEGMEHFLQEMLLTGKRVGVLKESHLNNLDVDTTVQEKVIAFPTDACLDYKMRDLLMKGAEVRSMAKKTRSVKLWLKRRSAIEPVIGHVKSDNGMARNRLKGTEGDKINALLSGCVFNMRKLLVVLLLLIICWRKIMQFFKEKLNRTIRFA